MAHKTAELLHLRLSNNAHEIDVSRVYHKTTSGLCCPSSCSEEGLHTVLGYRNVSRLHATTGLLGLSLMTDSSDTWLMETLSSESSTGVVVLATLLLCIPSAIPSISQPHCQNL